MNALVTLPRFLIGLSLILWGISTDRLILAAALAIVAEFARFSPIRWDLSTDQYYRAADYTSVFFALIVVYQFNEHSVYGIYEILGLLPLCIFPLLAVERYSVEESIPVSSLFLSLRRRIRDGVEIERPISLGLPYLLITVLAASAGAVAELVYFGAAAIILSAGLYRLREQRYPLVTWSAALLAAFALAFSIQGGIRLARASLEDSFTYWFHQFAWFQTDPNRERTAIGTIGRLKLSDRIRIRLDAPLSIPLPVYLHEASYTTFNLGSWSSNNARLDAIDPIPTTTQWTFGEQVATKTSPYHAEITIDHREDVSVAPLPYATTKLSGDEIIEVQRNAMSTTLVEAVPGQLRFSVEWGSNHLVSGAPTSNDTAVPENYVAVIEEVANEIGLTDASPAEAIGKVSAFFSKNFRYTLVQKGFYPGRTPLAHFLLRERSGHCEYFGTATALLLRHAGIPARYAVGYVVHEYSTLERAFVARARHAHSWVEAYVDGQWRVVDTTPGEWAQLEQDRVSGWQIWLDMWSWLSLRIDRIQRADHSKITDRLVWLLPPLLIILFWRLRTQARATSQSRAQVATPANDGFDTHDLRELATTLLKQGYSMRPGDTLRSFLEKHATPAIGGFGLSDLIRLHYQHRFGSIALSAEQITHLKQGAEAYVQHYRSL